MANKDQALTAAAGAAIGFLVGGPAGAAAGLKYGLLAGAVLFPADQPAIEGPKLEDFETAEADPGAIVPRIYGTVPLAGFRMYLGPVQHLTSTETQGGKGAAEQKVTTHTYLQTSAIGLCEGPIKRVTRIWDNGTLVYDDRAQQPDESQADYQARLLASATYLNDTDFVVYTGDEDQLPDPTLQAELGAENVPALRGLSYIVFPDWQLQEDQGRRHPLRKFEIEGQSERVVVAVGDGIAARSLDDGRTWEDAGTPPDGDMRCVAHDSYRGRFVAAGASTSVWYTDDAGMTWIEVADVVGAGASDAILDMLYLPAYDMLLACRGGSGSSVGKDLLFWSADGGLTWTGLVPSGLVSGQWIGGLCYKEDTDQVCFGGGAPSGTDSCFGYCAAEDIANPAAWTVAQDDVGKSGGQSDGHRRGMAYHSQGQRVVYGLVELSSFNAGNVAVSGVDDLDNWANVVTGTANNSDCTGVAYIPPHNMAVACYQTGGTSIAWSTTPQNSPWALITTGQQPARNWNSVRYNAETQEVIFAGNGHFAIASGQNLIDHALTDIAKSGDWRDVAIGGSGVGRSLKDVVEEICAEHDVTDIDAADLADTRLIGYGITRAANGRAQLDPLRMIGQFDFVESGETLRFRKRGGLVDAVISADELGASPEGSGGDARSPSIVTRVAQDLDLPTQIRLRYLSPSHDMGPAEQLSQPRFDSAGTDVQTIDLPAVIDDVFAAQLAEILMRDLWASRVEHEFSLGIDRAALEPADVVTVPAGGRDYRARLLPIVDSDLMIRRMKAVRDDDGAYVSTATAAAPIRAASLLQLLGLTDIELLDLPALDEAHDDAGLYLASWRIGSGTGWAGASLNRSVDGGETYSQLITMGEQAIVGTVVTAPAGDSRTWNDATELVVDVLNGQALESRTKLAVLNGANAAAIGAHGRWQIVQFRDAELIAADRYRLTRLLLGRRGTEHAIDTIVPGDRFVLISGPGIYLVGLQTAAIGASYVYRPVTSGASFETGTDENFAGNGERLMPLSPVRARGARDGSGNLTITWMRRDRLSEALRDGVAVPNSEASEAYEVDILDGETVVRTIAAGAATAAYSAAEQTADFGSAQSSVSLRIYQLSATVGRGTPAEATL